MAERLTHTDDEGRVHMVDVAGKDLTHRVATAEAIVVMSKDSAEALFGGTLPKGDAPATARVAGIMAAKKTPELIPLCHPIALTSVQVDIEPCDDGARVVATCETVARTGVEMEAMTAASVAALTIYDMVKGIQRDVSVRDVQLISKQGGKSGSWTR